MRKLAWISSETGILSGKTATSIEATLVPILTNILDDIGAVYKWIGLGRAKLRIWFRTGPYPQDVAIWAEGENPQLLWDAIQGGTYKWAYTDEGTKTQRKTLVAFSSRVRAVSSMISDMKTKILYSTNPAGPAHWFKHLIVDASFTNDQITLITIMSEARKATHIRDMQDRLEAFLTPRELQRAQEAMWSPDEGNIYQLTANNIIDHEDYREASRNRSGIWGIAIGPSGTTAAVKALKRYYDNGKYYLVIVDDFYYDARENRRVALRDIIPQIVRQFGPMPSVVRIDPKRYDVRRDLLDNLDKKRSKIVGTHFKDQMRSIEKTQRSFEEGKLFVTKESHNTLYAIDTQTWKPEVKEDVPEEKVDLMTTALRYVAAPEYNFRVLNKERKMVT